MAYGKKEADNRRFVPSIRSIFYLISFILIFGLTCAELGLVSQQIHKYGRFAENWASLQYRNVVGLLLCAVLVSLLITIFHFWLSVSFIAFFSLILSVFFGIGGGVIRTTTPFRRSCGTPTQNYPEKWQRFAGECTRIVAMQGISWSLFALYFFLLVGSLAYLFRISPRPTPGGFYGSHTRSVV
ncbi:hypothetical protein D9613_006477 [Agrocybe pediades]|uniref:Uncharacterized protein n=1 Tax=Agrocybe pediades TaxID=84607 RepID=A0A8H4QHT5_9AGAR|nr:hypothetical protein D9613_006477 [Agrocybe pediades]KAF9541278.1 hypothetical protein CPC08DRAFT_463732 [Agrocybe pediades]